MGPPQTAAMDTAQKSFTYYGDLKKRLLVAEALTAEYEKVMSPANQCQGLSHTVWFRENNETGRQIPYRVTSPVRKRIHLGPYRRPMLRVFGGSWGGGRFLMSEGPL